MAARPQRRTTSTSPHRLSASTSYYFYIAASVTAGDSAPSNTSSTTTTGAVAPTAAPAAPSNLALTVASSSQINLSWTSNDTVQNGFNLFRSSDGINFTQIATTAAGITSYADGGLSASTTYYYEVNAYDSVGTSAYSNAPSATTSAASSSAGSHLVTGNATQGQRQVILPGLGQTVAWSSTLGPPATVGVYVYNPDGSLTPDER